MSTSRAIAGSWLLFCAGCIGIPASVEASGSGVTTGRQTQTVRCGADATLDRYLAGAGGVAITISDGAHRKIYDDVAGVTGEINDSRDVSGDSGTWTFSVDPDGFAGQFKITLQCFAWVVDAVAPEPSL
jgi:hypothetical protein